MTNSYRTLFQLQMADTPILVKFGMQILHKVLKQDISSLCQHEIERSAAANKAQAATQAAINTAAIMLEDKNLRSKIHEVQNTQHGLEAKLAQATTALKTAAEANEREAEQTKASHALQIQRQEATAQVEIGKLTSKLQTAQQEIEALRAKLEQGQKDAAGLMGDACAEASLKRKLNLLKS